MAQAIIPATVTMSLSSKIAPTFYGYFGSYEFSKEGYPQFNTFQIQGFNKLTYVSSLPTELKTITNTSFKNYNRNFIS